MKKPLILMLVFSLFFLTRAGYAVPTSAIDLWDISQGSVVTANSPVYSRANCPIENMFGRISDSHEPEHALYSDAYPVGTEHWVEWQTPTPITLRSFNLVAAHDRYAHGAGDWDIRYRGFSEFKLYFGDGLGTWTLLYDYYTDPDGDMFYGGGPTYSGQNFLELAAIVTPTTSQYFRAVFVQAGDISPVAAGPRIIELDGFSTIIPEPATICLFGLGLLSLLCKRKNSLN